jgi:hypothetical protein
MAKAFGIIFSAIIIAATLAVGLRWQIVLSADGQRIVRLDRWSGAVRLCERDATLSSFNLKTGIAFRCDKVEALAGAK